LIPSIRDWPKLNNGWEKGLKDEDVKIYTLGYLESEQSSVNVFAILQLG